MGYLQDVIEAVRIVKDRRRKQECKHRIVYAFTSGGTKYYQFEDMANIAYERGLSALCVYNELEMRCSREYLIMHTDAIDKLLKEQKIDIYKIKQANDILKQRLMMATDVDLMYKLASVVYFDETENPLVYEPEYAEKKIAKWRKDNEVSAFFSMLPLSELVPFLKSVRVDLDTYSELQSEAKRLEEQALRLATSVK